ncbi:MAG: threonine aldolase [Marinilabiliales bacterium]|nr:MAG: threonine aldolase [Marinilabiliales bacterium]
MTQYSFRNDYSEGAHEKILKAISENNLVQEEGYGEDNISIKAAGLIRERTGNPDADVHFVSGGTQANLIVISALLKPHESVIAPATGHITVHEAGAIEATGHKINAVETKDGKLRITDIQKEIDFHEDEHMVLPKMVFISNSTETGCIYTKTELQELSECCKSKNLILYLDGARLGSALTSDKNDLTLKEISDLVDIFYIGGTKNGALLGEAIVINKAELKDHFRFHLKQKGALLAKGRVIGAQFLELFKDDLYFELSKHANTMAMKLAKGIKEAGHEFFTEPSTNQIFPILPIALIEKLSQKFGFYLWRKTEDDKAIIRLVTSWATKEEAVDSFIDELQKY